MTERDINLILDLIEDVISEAYFVENFSIKGIDNDENIVNRIIKESFLNKDQTPLEMGLILSGYFDFNIDEYMPLLVDAIRSPWHQIHELVLDYMIIHNIKDYDFIASLINSPKEYYVDGVFENIERKAQNYLIEKRKYKDYFGESGVPPQKPDDQ